MYCNIKWALSIHRLTSSSLAGVVAVLGGVEVVVVACAAGVGERLAETGLVVEVPALNLLAAVALRHRLVTTLQPRRLSYRHPPCSVCTTIVPLPASFTINDVNDINVCVELLGLYVPVYMFYCRPYEGKIIHSFIHSFVRSM